MAIKDVVKKTSRSGNQEQGMQKRNDLGFRDEDRNFGIAPLAGFEVLPQFHREMNRLFESFFGDPGPERGMMPMGFGREDWQAFTPNIDLKDDGKEVRVVAELPGIDEKDLEVELTGDRLMIHGQKREETEEQDKEGWRRIERRFGSFDRTVTLPEGIDTDKVKAEFKNGVLTVSLPRRPEAQVERRKISVGTGEGTSSGEKKAA